VRERPACVRAVRLAAYWAAVAGPVVRPDGEIVVLEGTVSARDAKRYVVLPFVVADGIARLEVAYTWEPGHDTVLDLGLWDERGYRAADGFRGWSGSRQGLIHDGHDPVWVEAHAADRCFTPGPIRGGTWYVELGVGAVAAGGATYRVELRGTPSPGGPPRAPAPDRVDRDHVARAGPGWFHADLHQHGHHSYPRAPGWEELVEHSRRAGLDVLPFVEYVVTRHWDELGAVQRAHPDLLVYPGREVITYYGHVIVLGETPGWVEYRHGLEDVTIAAMQQAALAHGAIVGIAHPTLYPEDEWGSFCRGCYFQLGDDIDWAGVHLFEVVTGSSYFERHGLENPFVDTALARWYECLNAGHRLTAVAGSDDKLGRDYGSAATTIGASALSRAAVRDALLAGHAYVRARGVARSPELELVATAAGLQATFGGTLEAAAAEVIVGVHGARGQRLRLVVDGDVVDDVAVADDDVERTWTVERRPASGPLGTFVVVETRDEHGLTALGNPVYLR
jgi:hypothetical protein